MSYPPGRLQTVVTAFCLVTALATTAIAQSKSPVAPTEQAYNGILKEAYDNFKDDTGGKNADYIPALAKVTRNCTALRSSLPMAESTKLATLTRHSRSSRSRRSSPSRSPWRNMEPTRSSKSGQ